MKSKRQKLLDKLDALCSLYVRKRDNKCILCGGHIGEIEKLQSHHWIVRRSRSLRYKYDERNCVSLCYACHILKIHNSPTVLQIDELKNRAILNNVATLEDIEEIKQGCEMVYKMSIADIEDKIKYFEEKIKELEK